MGLASCHERPLGRVLASALALAALTGGVAASGAGAALPDGRAYELVTSLDKGGNDALGGFGLVSSDDGNRVSFRANTPYGPTPTGGITWLLGSRTASGWTFENLIPPALGPDLTFYKGGLGIEPTDDLSSFFYKTNLSLDPADDNAADDVYVGDAADTTWVSQGPLPRTAGTDASFVGRSADGSHILFQTSDRLLPEDAGRLTGRSLYERVGGQLRLVNVKDDGSLTSACGATLGSSELMRESGGTLDAVSTDGSRIVFTSPDPGMAGSPECPEPPRLYMRIDGQTTIELSAPEFADPNGPQPITYAGASADGSKVFFTTTERLTADDPGNARDLYEYDVENSQLTRISAGQNGAQDANVPSIQAISADGSHVYFIAYAQLVPGEGEDLGDGQNTIAGNLYAYSGGTVKFIGLVTVADFNWLEPGLVASTAVAPDGSRFVFTSAEILTGDAQPFDPSSRHLYLYDDATSSLACISCGVVGPLLGGARFGEKTVTSHRRARTMSDDGRFVFFESLNALVPEDVNGRWDVYEWHDGVVSLLSSGRFDGTSRLLDATPDGHDVFIAAYDRLSAQDRDASEDIYDVRIGGVAAPAPSEPCSGETCRGAASTPPASLLPASALLLGDGNLGARRSPRFVVGRIGSAGRRALARTGRLRLSVSVGASGRVSAKARVRLGGRARTVASASKRAARAGRVRLVLTLSPAARAELARSGRLSLRIRVAYSRVPHAKSIRLSVRRPEGR